MTTAVGSPVHTQSVRLEYALDPDPGAAKRLGLVLLATDHTSERDFRRMLPPVADCFVSRVRFDNPTTIENLRALAADLTRATDLLVPGSDLHAVAFGCTAGTVAIGEEAIAERLAAARPGVPSTTPIRAALVGFAALAVRRVAMLVPYMDEVIQPVRAFLEDHGVAVTAITSFNIESDVDMARIPPTAIVEAGVEADRPDADALFVSCTALRAAQVAEALEARLGKPVVTSNQALCWHALRLAGIACPVPGHGRLLREP
jgi:maleate isomerase